MPDQPAPQLFPEGPGDRFLGDLMGGRKPSPSDVASLQKSGLLPSLTTFGITGRAVIIWAIVAILFIVGVWGLVAPGGGVAVIQRAAK